MMMAPGVVAVPQTFRSVLQPHLHLHALATRGVWDRHGQRLPAAYVDTLATEKLFAHEIFRLLEGKGLLSDERTEFLMSGSAIDANRGQILETRVKNDDEWSALHQTTVS